MPLVGREINQSHTWAAGLLQGTIHGVENGRNDMQLEDGLANKSIAVQLVQRLESLRAEKNMTKVDLSRRAGYSNEYWISVTNGLWQPTLAAFCDHAEALGLSLTLREGD